ncbi:hypothetical protein C8P66_1142 [Humitalea rosea]|uniref:MOSC domain-containing protein n=1 Tax=Humitalea rosea TaxID=990373 RepID=A0A2W7J170_9PROT|nr:MOSC domain-containing protein [Humitalea rosea]PZW44713.1 hypothetical protein C8P66_1142 [Humitalea rosea]
MRIEQLYRYPVKGLTAEALEEVVVEEGQTLPHDRRFALAQGDSGFDPEAPRFRPKQNFACLMANAKVALVQAGFDPRSGILALAAPGRAPLAAQATTPEGRAEIAVWLSEFLADEARGTMTFVEAPGHAFTDQVKKGVSLINMASLHALEAAIGRKLDPLRFRANIYFTGLPAWAEFDWIGSRIQAGGATLEVFKRTIRCPATQVDLATGTRDLDIPALMRQHFGHADLGVHATVVESGRIARGDAIERLP